MAEWMQDAAGRRARAAARRAPAGEAAGVVLIVDDMPDNLAVLHDALDESGYTVLVATDGASAIARAAQALPDIVLLDALMPGMDGFEVARRLKADEATAPIPIVFMTGADRHRARARRVRGRRRRLRLQADAPARGAWRASPRTCRARATRAQARNALDAFGHASIALRPADGRVLWQTPLARDLMQRHFGAGAAGAPIAGAAARRRAAARAREPVRLGARARHARAARRAGDGRATPGPASPARSACTAACIRRAPRTSGCWC